MSGCRTIIILSRLLCPLISIYVWSVRDPLSSGGSMMIFLRLQLLMVSACCFVSIPTISGSSPSVRSNVREGGLQFSSLTVNVHELFTGLALSRSVPILVGILLAVGLV